MSSFQIIVGSMLGGSEYVAEACQETLESLAHQTELHLTPVFDEISHKNQTWLICTSTHGAGEFPDNIQAFVQDLINCDQDLSSTQFLVIGVGDSSYDTFCQAAKNIEKTLLSKGCNKVANKLELDMSQDIDPEELSQTWLLSIKDQL